jgi:hypothetical protein
MLRKRKEEVMEESLENRGTDLFGHLTEGNGFF